MPTNKVSHKLFIRQMIFVKKSLQQPIRCEILESVAQINPPYIEEKHMSLENAILDHAAALRELAAAFVTSATARNQASAVLEKAYAQSSSAAESKGHIEITISDEEKQKIRDAAKKDAELEEAVQKVEAEAKARDEKADAKKNAGAADTQTSTGGATAGSVEEQGSADLDYEKHVKPILIKLASAKGKPEMTALVQSFGVTKATELKGAQLAQIVAKANALMAA